MQATRTLTRTPIRRLSLLKPKTLNPFSITSRKMSLFPRTFINDPHQANFPSVFRLLDEFNDLSRNVESSPIGRTMKSFNPKFDVKEVKNAYELHGELPGIEQKNIEIEFTDTHTLTIKGRTERTYQKSNPPAGFIEAKTSGKSIEGAKSDKHNAHKATVADEDKENQTSATKEIPPAAESEEKFWVSERTVGEFSRSFSFPVQVDQDAVTASMKNGILSIVVPKAKKPESKRITIQ